MWLYVWMCIYTWVCVCVTQYRKCLNKIKDQLYLKYQHCMPNFRNISSHKYVVYEYMDTVW